MRAGGQACNRAFLLFVRRSVAVAAVVAGVIVSVGRHNFTSVWPINLAGRVRQARSGERVRCVFYDGGIWTERWCESMRRTRFIETRWEQFENWLSGPGLRRRMLSSV